jgi:hypothetical protein
VDNITPEALKTYVETTENIVYPLLEKIWAQEKLPAEWKKRSDS